MGRDHAPFTGTALDPRSGTLIADPEDGRWDNYNGRNLNPEQIHIHLYHGSEDDVTEHFTPRPICDLTPCLVSISAPIPATGPSHIDNPPIFLLTGKSLSLHSTPPFSDFAIDPYRGTKVTTNRPPASPKALAPSDHLLSSYASPVALTRDSPTSATLRSLQHSSITLRTSTSRATQNATPKHLPFEVWNSSHSTSTWPTAATYGSPPPLGSPRPSNVMLPTPIHHATLAMHVGGTRTRGGRYVPKRSSAETLPNRTAPSPKHAPSSRISLSHAAAPKNRFLLTRTVDRSYRRRATQSFHRAILHRLSDTASPLLANVCFDCAFPTAQEAHSILHPSPTNLEAARNLVTKFYHTGQLPLHPTPPATPSGSLSLDVWGRTDWRDKRLLLPSGAVAFAVTVAPSATRPRKRAVPAQSPLERSSPPTSSLSSAYTFPSATSSTPTPLVVWIRILAADVNNPPSSPLLDLDECSQCIELSFDEATAADAAYHAWHPDPQLQRRWSNVFPSPARLPCAPEGNNPTPTGTIRPSSDNPPLPSPNRALSAMREVLTWLVDNQYMAVGLSSPLSKSNFILFYSWCFRTLKAR